MSKPHAITEPTFEPEWKPLVELLGEELCGAFMFMATYPTNGGRHVHTYKHRVTRRYLNIDEEGVCYRYCGGAYQQIPADEALAHAYG